MALEASQPQGFPSHSTEPLVEPADQPPHVKRQRRMAAVLLLSSSLAMLEERATSLPSQAPRLALPSSKHPHKHRQQATLSQARGLTGSRLHAQSITITTSKTGTAATGADAKGSSRHRSERRACGLARVYQRSVAPQHLPDDYWECFPAGSTARQLLHQQQQSAARQQHIRQSEQQPVALHAQPTGAVAAPGTAMQHTMISPPGSHTAGLPVSATDDAVRAPNFAAQPGSGLGLRQMLSTEPCGGHTAGLGSYGLGVGAGAAVHSLHQLQPAAGQSASMLPQPHGPISAAGAAGPEQAAGMDQSEGGAEQGEEEEEAEEEEPELPPASPGDVPELPPASPTQDDEVWEDI